MFSFFKANQKLSITDDSGFLAIVNASLYTSFIDEDWELTELFNHFVSEMNKDSVIVWATGSENEWTLAITDKASGKKAFRQFSKSIFVTDEKLYLTNYEDLTNAAQFEDVGLPAKHNSGLVIPLENGLYNVTVRQMFDPENDDYNAKGKVNFEIVIAKTDASTERIDKVWWQAD